MSLPALRFLQTPPRAALVFALWLVAAWLLLHLYWGIRVDAVIYTMQGLAHLHPDLYGNDIFIRYGSQDRYTLFGPLYAQMIRVFGVDYAATIWTAASQAAWFLAAWQLCRRLMSTPLAWLALAVLVAFALPYGGQGVFYVVEDFMSARQLSEALVLFGLTAALSDRPGRALGCFAAAMALHPIMGAAGLGWYLWLRLLSGRTWVLQVVGVLAALALLQLGALLPWAQPLRMDKIWLSRIVADTPYLMLNLWSRADWSRTLVPWLTLGLAMALPSLGMVRRLAGVTLGVAIAGTGLSLVAGAWLHWSWMLQAQPWRWQWLAVTVSALLLPLIGATLWNLGARGRTALALLIAALMSRDLLFGPALLAFALVMTLYAVRASSALRTSALVLLICIGVLALGFGMAWEGAMRWVALRAPSMQFVGYPMITSLWRLGRDSLLPALLLGFIWLAVFVRQSLWRLRVLALAALLAIVALLPVAYSQWSDVVFTPAMMQAFAPWRARIPAGAEVLLAEDPLYTWVFLQRPNYFSVAQLGTTLFSRPAALVLAARLFSLQTFLSGEYVIRSNNPYFRTGHMTLRTMCQVSDVSYIVSHQDLQGTALATMPEGTPFPYRDWKLYGCDPIVPGS